MESQKDKKIFRNFGNIKNNCLNNKNKIFVSEHLYVLKTIDGFN